MLLLLHSTQVAWKHRGVFQLFERDGVGEKERGNLQDKMVTMAFDEYFKPWEAPSCYSVIGRTGIVVPRQLSRVGVISPA